MKKLWYRQPAKAEEETLPLGCGTLGAMMWGETLDEKIQMNQETLWSGTGEEEPEDPEKLARIREAFPAVRKLIREEKYAEAEALMEKELLGSYTESYMPAGDVMIHTELPEGRILNYRRELDLAGALQTTAFTYGIDEEAPVEITREAFISCIDQALYVRQKMSRKADIVLSFTTPEKLLEVREEENGFTAICQLPEHVDPNYLGATEEPIVWGPKGRKYPVRLRVLFADGFLKAEEQTVRIEGAAEVFFSVHMVNDLPKDRKEQLQGILPELLYDETLKVHLEEYLPLYEASDIELYPDRSDLPTDERLRDPDPGLYALYYQYGRYLLLASSRKCLLPATLQGIWSWQMRAPWSSNYTTNINLEMNYWPALAAGLEICEEPYTDFIRRICEAGKTSAKKYGFKGSFCGHNSDIYLHTYPVGVKRGDEGGEPSCLMWAYYVMAEVWMDQEIYQRYVYHPDPVYLKETVYPLLKESVIFLLDYLVKQDGYYVTSPAATPENRFLKDGFKVSASYATTMDMTMIRELFRNFRNTVTLLEEPDDEAKELILKIDKVEPELYPVHLNKDGSVCEWFSEQEEVEKGHRHLSHLYGLFPSDLWREDEAMRKAAEKTLENRMAAGGGHTGWSLSWVLNLYTVLKKPEMVDRYLKQMFERSTYPNLWDKHPPFQIDGNFGMTAAICHMLVEEKEEVSLLPCLPTSWKDGKVKGICIPGGRSVSFEFSEGKVKEETIVICEERKMSVKTE